MAARSGSGRGRVAFRPDPARAASNVPSRRQAVALIAALLVVAGAISAASFLARPDKARAFDLFYGSVYIDDATAPVAVDLASGKPTVQLVNAFNEVSATASDQLHVVPLQDRTLLLNTATGEFNMLDSTGFVLKGTGGGVQLPPLASSTAAAVPSGQLAYIVQSSSSRTAVYLVSDSTVTSATDKTARARATYEFDQGSSDVQTTAVSANGDLWLLTGSASRRTVRQLHLPAGSKAGVELQSSSHGTVSGAAGVAASTNTTGPDTVAVASASGLDVYGASTGVRHSALPGLTGLDRVLPAHGEQNGFAFLLHDATGWALATAASDGGSVKVHRITDLPAQAQLIPPGFSEGALYTMDTATGRLWRLALSGEAAAVPGRAEYPLTKLERANHFAGAAVIVRGARAIINAPQHDLALTVFTDGSAQPVVIDKRSAISVSPTGPSLTGLNPQQPQHAKPTQSPTTAPKPSTPINEKIDCAKVSQVPHPPVVQLDERGSRSVQLSWTYPQLTPQDCLPSTYTVTATVTSGQAPPPPGTVTVQGSTGVILTGLFPDTQYQLVVTAYINGQGTPSLPLPVRTSVEGPAAPTNVQATTDNAGNWNLSWSSCGGVQNGCVQSAQWRIVPQICGNAPGLVSSPAVATAPGDPTLSSFTYTYAGGNALLGRGLSFVVEGVGQTGVLGSPGTASACTYSWQPPNPANIQLAAAVPPGKISVGGTATATANLTFTGDPDVAAGGVGGQFTYQLLSGGSVVTTVGPTSATSAQLTGIQPGQTYQVQASVIPPRHPEAAVSVGPVNVNVATANWPALSVAASFANSQSTFYTGSLTLNISGLASAQARGETFDLASGSQIQCGSATWTLQANNFDPGQPLVISGVDRSQVYGTNCQATVILSEDAGTQRNPPYFGGTPSSPATSAAFTITPPDFITQASEFTAGFEANQPRNAQVVAVAFAPVDPHEASFIANNTAGWSLQLSNDGGSTFNCGSSTTNPAGSGAQIAVPTNCLKGATTWKVRISFSYFGNTPDTLPFTISANATNVPQPVDPSNISFKATYCAPGSLNLPCGLNISNVYILTKYSGSYSAQVMAQLNWTVTITADEPGNCGSFTTAPDQNGPNDQWQIDTTACPTTHAGTGGATVQTTYTITLSFVDPVYGTTGTYSYSVTAS